MGLLKVKFEVSAKKRERARASVCRELAMSTTRGTPKMLRRKKASDTRSERKAPVRVRRQNA